VSPATSGFFFGIDTQSRLQELGNLQYPSMQWLASAAQYLNFQGRLQATIDNENRFDSPLIINVFNRTVMNGPVNATVTMPSVATLQTYSKLELDASLGCVGAMDSSCPAVCQLLRR
jgi:hypothetical protein